MQVQYTTEKGAQINLVLIGTKVDVSVNGQEYGRLSTAQDHPQNGYVLRVVGKAGMIGVPASALAEVKVLIAEQGVRIGTEYAKTDEAKFGSAMMIYERNDDDGVDRAERVWR